MAGHSKWAQIKHKKAANDLKRGKLFSRLSRLITVAARKGVDPKMNIPLAQAIDQAKSFNMPADNIERSIKKVADKDSLELQELSISVIGPAGIALKIKAITDNSNRTMSEVKKILSNHNSKLVPPGSIDWMFSQQPPEDTAPPSPELDSLLETLAEHDDVQDVLINNK